MSAVAEAELPVILVVEDDPEALDQRTGLLATLQSAPIGKLSDNEAREVILQLPVDLVLTDIRLGVPQDDRSGIDLARYVKSIYPDLPVIGYSARVADDELSSAEKEVFDEVWPKNLDYMQIEELMQRCRSLAVAHQDVRRAASWELFLKSEMFDMRTIPTAAIDVLPDLNEQDQEILRLVAKGRSPRQISEQLEIEEDDLYRFVSWVLEELPPEPSGETMSDVHSRHGSRPANSSELAEFEQLYGPFSPPDEEG